MAKMIISENRLHELIQESIYEVLQEAQYDEGLGHWLGNKFQTARNKVRNFVNDFKAGQNDARERNKDYNSYSIYGDREDAVRRMGNGAYPNYRYDLETRRNQRARQGYGEDGTPYPNQGGGRTNTPPQSPQNQANPLPIQIQGNPDLEGSQQTPQSTTATPQQTQQQAPAAQPQGNMQPMNGRQNPINPNDSTIANKAAWEAKMKKMGLVNKGTVQRPQWHNANGGKLTPVQKNAIQQWSRFKLNEQKKELNKLIKEVKNKKKNVAESRFNNSFNPNSVYIVCDGSSYYGIYGSDIEDEIKNNDVEIIKGPFARWDEKIDTLIEKYNDELNGTTMYR